MKTTILLWDRREGKTHKIVEMIKEIEKTESPINDILVLTHNHNAAKYIYGAYPELRRYGIKIIPWDSHIHELHPKHIFIDDAEFMSEKIYREVIPPLSTIADELILTSSDKKVFELIDGGYRDLYYYIKSLVKSVKDGELSEKLLISLLENEIKRMEKKDGLN